MFVNGLNGVFDEIDVFFREGFVESDEAVVISTGILYVGRLSVKPLLDGILRDKSVAGHAA